MKLEFKSFNAENKYKVLNISNLNNIFRDNLLIESVLVINGTEELILYLIKVSFEENIGLSILNTNDFKSDLKNILKFNFVTLLIPKDQLKDAFKNQEFKLINTLEIESKEYCLIELINLKSKLKYEKSIILFTSGSSGLRKPVKISHKSMLDCANFMADSMLMNQYDKEIIYAQLDHAFAIGRILSCAIKGSSFCFWDSKKMLRPTSIEKIMSIPGLNGFSSMPSVLFSILSINRYASYFAKSLKYVQMGAMYLPAERKNFILNKLPGSRIFVHYGMTEYMRATFFDISKYPNKLITEGPPSKATEIKILNLKDFENKTMDNKNEIFGEILIKGPHLCEGYLDKDEWDKRVTKDGFFMTGDIGFLDKDGFLIHKGRKDNTFNFQGKLFNCKNLLNQLVKEFEYLKDKALVIPFRDENSLKDFEVFVCIINNSSFDKENDEKIKIKKYFAKLGLSISVKHFEDDFPRTQNGKIAYGKILKMISKSKIFDK